MEEINEYEIDGLIQTMKETGIKGLMKYTDVLVLNHMMEQYIVNSTQVVTIQLYLIHQLQGI